MAKESSSSSRIPRLGEGISRIPMPGAIRIPPRQSQAQQHLPPSLPYPQQKLKATTTKIARPNAVGIMRPSVTSIAALKKSITGESFTEAAANIMKGKTANVMRKFLTKPEKSEKNIEMKSQIQKTNDVDPVTNLEKGSRENSNEKLSKIENNNLPSTLTRSETFIRDTPPMMKTQSLNSEETETVLSNQVYNNVYVKTINSSQNKNESILATPMLNATNDIKQTFIQSTPAIMNRLKFLDKTHLMDISTPNVSIIRTINSNRSIVQSTPHLNLTHNIVSDNLFGVTHDIIDCSHNNSKRSSIDPFKTRTLELTNEINKTFPGVRRSATFDQLDPDVKLNSNDKDINERLIDISCPSLDNLDSNNSKSCSSLRNSILSTFDFPDADLVQLPDKKDMKLALNTRQSTEFLLDLNNTISQKNVGNNIKSKNLMYMSPHSDYEKPIYSRKTNSRTSLLARTPDDFLCNMEPMDIDDGAYYEIPPSLRKVLSHNTLQDLRNNQKPRFSFGFDLTESTLDCSIELCDISLTSAANSSSAAPSIQDPTINLKKQNSFDLDESLGILTPDQMKEFLDSNTQNTNNLELPFITRGNKMALHQMRIDQTPSPEELPLDPVGVKIDTDIIMTSPPNIPSITNSINTQNVPSTTQTYTELSQADNSESKTDQMTKSNTSKVSTSFITSVTSITSLDNGYQGDGEMSRPASRGGGDHSPSNGPKIKQQIARQPSFNNQHILVRRQDPMTDSDFFTESDADVDIMNRGDRRAQIIDGQLYGPMLQQPSASVFISEQPEMEDSCMESSGIFTDIENRCDDDLAQNRTLQPGDVDMSPDGSTDTVKSKHQNNIDYATGGNNVDYRSSSSLSQGQCQLYMSDSQTSSTINSSLSSDRISVTTADYCPKRESFCGIATEDIPELQVVVAHDKRSTTLPQEKAFTLNTKNTCTTSKQQLVKKQTSPCKHGQTVLNEKYGTTSIKNSEKLNKTLQSNITSARKSKLNIKSKEMLNANKKSLSPKHVNIEIKNVSDPTNTTGSSNNSSSISISSNIETKHNILKSPNNINTNNNPINLQSRKFPPNKWDAVMNKIAENKSQEKIIKKKLLHVKSKVSTGVNSIRKSPSSIVNNKYSINDLSNNSSVDNNEYTSNIKSDSVQNNGSFVNDENNILIPNVVSVDKNDKITSSNKITNKLLTKSSGANSGLASPRQSKRIGLGPVKRGRSYSKESSQSDLSLSGGSPKLLVKTPLRTSKKRDVRNLSISPTDLGPPSKTQTIATTPNGITRSKNPTSNLLQKRSPSITASTAISNATSKGSPSPPKKLTNIRRSLADQKPAKAPLKEHNRLISHQQNVNTTKTLSNGDVKLNGTTKLSTPLASTINHNNNSSNSSNHNKSKNLIEFTPSPVLNGSPIANLNKKNIQQQNSSQDTRKTQSLQRNEENIKNNLDETKLLKNNTLIANNVNHNKKVEALGVVIQYLAHDLDAFSCPGLKKNYLEAQKCLYETKNALEDFKTTCHELQDQLQDKEVFYTTREQELQELHRCEISKVETSLVEIQTNAKERITSLELELSLKDENNQKKFQSYCQETELKIKQQENDLQIARDREQELLQRIEQLSTNENELRDKIQEAEASFSERLQCGSQKEQNLSIQILELQKQLDLVKEESDQRIRDFEQKLQIANDEVSVLRHSQHLETSSVTPSKSQNAQMLQNEVESLRCVLEIKQTEIATLRKKNQELTRSNEDLQSLQVKCSGLETRLEVLQMQLKSKAGEEKELLSKVKQLQDQYSQETKSRTRLSLHNEELQWKLRQNTEKYQATLTELSKSYQDKTGYMNCSRTSFYNQENPDISHHSSLSSTNKSICSERCFEMDDVSPPASPIIKGVVEKSDSVSWVLEMDDESPEILASRMVRRAGSFRSSFNEKCLSTKRQCSLPAPALHPLQQSASATLVVPHTQHSNESNVELPSRTRSKSVTIKSSDLKKSNGSRKIEATTSWKEPVGSSSPYNRRGSIRISPPSSLSNGSKQMSKSFSVAESTDLFPRKQSRYNCDQSNLQVQHLESLKKKYQHQEIQESAGEAMVSGTNSEDDEHCRSTSSSDESSSIDNIGEATAICKKQSMSIEDVLLLDKINALSTPMDVSWSSDAADEQFLHSTLVTSPNESLV